MTRETKIGMIVAGSFLSLVGVVVGTKLYKRDLPENKTPETVASTTEPGRKDPLAPGSAAPNESNPPNKIALANITTQGGVPPLVPPPGSPPPDLSPTFPPAPIGPPPPTAPIPSLRACRRLARGEASSRQSDLPIPHRRQSDARTRRPTKPQRVRRSRQAAGQQLPDRAAADRRDERLSAAAADASDSLKRTADDAGPGSRSREAAADRGSILPPPVPGRRPRLPPASTVPPPITPPPPSRDRRRAKFRRRRRSERRRRRLRRRRRSSGPRASVAPPMPPRSAPADRAAASQLADPRTRLGSAASDRRRQHHARPAAARCRSRASGAAEPADQ